MKQISLRLVLVAFLACFSLSAVAQSTVSGVVRDKSEQSLPGVSVIVKGANVGVSTDANGKFSIKAKEGSTLQFISLGHVTQSVTVISSDVITVTMVDDTEMLDEAVVTALGMSREKKSLGYAVTEMKGSDISRANVVSPILGMQGKVAGVQVNAGAAGPQSSNRIQIRGNSSLGTNNQPIFIIDGVIIDNTVTDNGAWGEVKNFGNDIKNLNTDDFESISILKGAAASALYGSRAANGVILITTKKGKVGEGLGISITQNMTWDNVYKFPNIQNEYGPGLQPVWNIKDGVENRSTTDLVSFGPKFDGKPYYRDGKEMPYQAYPNNVKDMYQTGQYRNTNVALQGGDENGAFRFSYSNLNSNGVTPNNHFKRNSFSLNASRKINKYISADGGVSWVTSDAKNPTSQGGGRSPIYDFMYERPRDYDTKYWMSHYKNEKGDGYNTQDPYGYSSTLFSYMENNYLQQENNFRGFLNIDFKLTDWLTFKAKGDMYRLFTTYEEKILATGKENYEGAKYLIDEKKKSQYKMTAMLVASKQFGDVGVNAAVATETWNTVSSYLKSWTVNGLYNPGQYILANSKKQAETEGKNVTGKKRINSIYGFVNLDYKNQLFLDLTARQDWSSTLIYKDGSGQTGYFYPSASASWLVSETFKESLPSAISFVKVRGSYAIVGKDTEPYLTSKGNSELKGTFVNPHDGKNYPYYEFDSNDMPNKALKPEKQHAIEFGLDLRFFDSRLGLDVAWYRTNTKNQILRLNTPLEMGFKSKWINAGNLQNSGIEVAITGVPVRTRDWNWTLSGTITANRGKVVDLYPGVEQYEIEYNNMDLYAYARVGGAYSDIVTPYAFKRNERGEKLLNKDGAWMRSGTREYIGSSLPKFLYGLQSSLSYKGFTLNAILDARYGGMIASGSYNYGMYSGVLEGSLYGRDKEHGGLERKLSDGRVINDGMIPEGVFGEGEFAGRTFAEVYKEGKIAPVSAQKYYENLYSWGSGIREAAVLETSWIALRELSLHYSLPAKWTSKVYLKGVNVGLVARNLGYLYNSLPENIHPEGLNSNRSTAFVEIGGSPYIRQFGFNINITL